MKHRIAFHQRLSFRLAKIVIILAFLLSVLMSVVQIFIDYQNQNKDFSLFINEVISQAELPASRSVHTLDLSLASEVVEGLLVYDSIRTAKITDELGEVLAQDRNPTVVTPHWLATSVFNRVARYNRDLKTKVFDQDSNGSLEVEVNLAIAYGSFVERAIWNIILSFAKNFILILIFFYTFYLLITRPIIALGLEIDQIDTSDPNKKRLDVPKDHEKDELGALARATNSFINAAEVSLKESKQSQTDLAESFDILRRVIDSLPHRIYLKDEKGDFIIVNRSYAANFNQSDQLEKSNQENIIDESEAEVLSTGIQKLIPEFHTTLGDDQQCVLEMRKIPLEYKGRPAVLSVAIDITEQRNNEERLKHLAFHDPLTNLPNRHQFLTLLQDINKELLEIEMFGALLFIDLDNFKVINDSLGHKVGDELLIQVSVRLSEEVASNAIVARLGGDEFIICLPSLDSGLDEAERKAISQADYLRELISQPYYHQGNRLTVTASIGITIFPTPENNENDLLRNADTALYQAKNKGRDTHIIFEKEMAIAATRRLAIENDLRDAITRNEFFMVYQPQYLQDGKTIHGLEALLRWQHPTEGLLPPFEFIPVLESTGLIIKVGYWIIEQACTTISNWIKQGIWRADQMIGINVSPQQFHHSRFVERVIEIIERSKIPTSCIDLEITEGLIIDNFDETITKISALREFGVSFSIDDFGTGYSSLSYLKRLPVDVLKVDQSFVRDLETDPDDIAIVETIISIAHHFNLGTIAEGVETKEQLDHLVKMGCQRFQGYYLSRPIPKEDAEKLLSDQSGA